MYKANRSDFSNFNNSRLAKQFKQVSLKAALLAMSEEPVFEGLGSVVQPVSVVKPSCVSGMLSVSLPLLRSDTCLCSSSCWKREEQVD